MTYGIYFRLYRIFRSEKISIFLTRIWKTLYLLKFLVKKAFLHKRKIMLTREQAEKRIRDAYPDPGRRPVYPTGDNKEGGGRFLLSIIIPVYNYADVLNECLDSVIRQKTQYSYEVIIIDDGSTDGSADVIEKYGQYDNVRFIRQENQGIGAARNRGLDEAVGKYIMFIDCDDCIHEDLVEKMLSRAAETDADIVECAYNLVKKRNGQIYQVIPNIYPESDLTGYGEECRLLNYEGLPWGKVYKSGLFDGVRYFPGYWNEDTIIQWLIFPQCKKFSYISEAEYDYSWYENNFSHIQGKQSDIRSLEYLWLLKAIMERYDELAFQKGEFFYCLLLTHLSWYLYPKLRELGEEILEAAFVAAGTIVKENRPSEPCQLPYVLKQVEKSFLQDDYELWKLASCFH